MLPVKWKDIASTARRQTYGGGKLVTTFFASEIESFGSDNDSADIPHFVGNRIAPASNTEDQPLSQSSVDINNNPRPTGGVPSLPQPEILDNRTITRARSASRRVSYSIGKQPRPSFQLGGPPRFEDLETHPPRYDDLATLPSQPKEPKPHSPMSES